MLHNMEIHLLYSMTCIIKFIIPPVFDWVKTILSLLFQESSNRIINYNFFAHVYISNDHRDDVWRFHCILVRKDIEENETV